MHGAAGAAGALRCETSACVAPTAEPGGDAPTGLGAPAGQRMRRVRGVRSTGKQTERRDGSPLLLIFGSCGPPSSSWLFPAAELGLLLLSAGNWDFFSPCVSLTGTKKKRVLFFFLIIILFFGFVVLPQTLILPSPSPPLLLHPSPPNNCLLPLFPARFPGALAFVEGRRGRCPPRSIGLLTAGCGWWDRPALRGCWRQSWPEGGEAGGADMCRRAGCERRQQQTPAPRRVAVWRGDSLGSRLCSRCVHCCQWQCSFRGGKRNCSFAVPRS